MIEVEMSKDIREFEPKLIGPFSARQFLFIGIACAYGIPFMISFKALPIMPRVVVGMALMAPVLACGFVKVFGMYLGTFFFRYVLGALIRPATRKFVSTSVAEEGPEKPFKKIERSKNIKGRK